jgi:hypothetical protein
MFTKIFPEASGCLAVASIALATALPKPSADPNAAIQSARGRKIASAV